MARADDDRAKQTIAEAGRILGLGLANLVSIRNPQIIVIGGGVAAAGNLLLTPARQPYANGLNRSRRNRFVLCAAVWGAELEFWAPQSSVSMNARNEYDLSSS
jgi:glucokinase